LTCTSSNAGKAFQWCFDRASKIFFFPDQHLGRNTALAMGISEEQIIVWDPGKPLGGNTEASIRNAKVILWHGYCLVHTRFQSDHIAQVRQEMKNVKIIVHPECTKEVVQAADAVGSTGFIENYVKQAPVHSTIAIGTEINFVNRLGMENPDKQVIALHPSLCPNMYKINLEKLLKTMESIGTLNVITIPDDIKQDAKTALEKMLSLQ
jgi:quinolinate synthase